MTKSQLAINVPLIHLSIKSITKPCLKHTILSIENKVIYFGPNWKLPFSALSHRSISQLENLLEDYDNNGGRLSGTKDISFVFESDDLSKVFECFFDNFSRIKKELMKFLHEFLKRYDKWEQKQNNKETRLVEDYTPNYPNKGGTRSGSANLSSRFFAGNPRNSSQLQHTSHDSRPMVKKLRTATKYKSKIDKLKEKMLSKLKQDERYWSDDEGSLESKKQLGIDSQLTEFEDFQESHTDVQVSTEENVTSKRNNPEKSFKQRSKLKKKGERKAIEDDDSDIDFGENNKVTLLKKAQYLNNDDDNDDDHDHDIGEMDNSRLNTELTLDNSKVASITPLRSQNISPLANHKPTDDLVTDDEYSDQFQSSPKSNVPKSGIRSFFAPSKVDRKRKLLSPGIVTKVFTTKHQCRENQQLSPFKKHKSENSLVASPARTTFSPSTHEICKKRKTFECHTPQKVAVSSPKLKAVTFCPRSLVPSKLSPVKNPYQKSTSPRALDISHLGLKNLGNTCYINSSLQMLFSLPHFLEKMVVIYKNLKSTQADDKETMPLCHSILSVASALRLIPCFVQNDSVREGTANPSILKKQIDNLTDKFAGYEQRDAHEFLSDLIDMLHDELAVSAKRNKCMEDCQLPTDEYFCLTVNVTLTCNCCNYSRSKQEMYRHLSIDIGTNTYNQDEQWTILKGLENFFKPEVRDIKCEKCKEGTSVTQMIAVKSRPKALLLHLKRFRMETKDGQVIIRKSSGCVKSGESVSLDPFMENRDDANRTSYKLKGVVRHIGNSSLAGHYTADALRMNAKGSNQEWVNFDDGSTSLTSLRDVLESEGSQSNNYLMLYSLE